MRNEGPIYPPYRRSSRLMEGVRQYFSSPLTRPPGITVIAVLHFLAAGVFILAFIGAVIQKPLLAVSDLSNPWLVSFRETQRLDAVFYTAVEIVLSLVVGIGLWH